MVVFTKCSKRKEILSEDCWPRSAGVYCFYLHEKKRSYVVVPHIVNIPMFTNFSFLIAHKQYAYTGGLQKKKYCCTAGLILSQIAGVSTKICRESSPSLVPRTAAPVISSYLIRRACVPRLANTLTIR